MFLVDVVDVIYCFIRTCRNNDVV